jgi:hypothetical protein
MRQVSFFFLSEFWKQKNNIHFTGGMRWPRGGPCHRLNLWARLPSLRVTPLYPPAATVLTYLESYT